MATAVTAPKTAAERASEFYDQAYARYRQATDSSAELRAQYEAAMAEIEDARLEVEWAMAHPALPEGYRPKEPGAAPKRRGRPRGSTNKKAETAPEPSAHVDPAPQAPAPQQEAVTPPPAPPAPVAAPEPQQQPPAPQAPPATAAPAPQTPPMLNDPFDPFAN